MEFFDPFACLPLLAIGLGLTYMAQAASRVPPL